MEKDRFRLRSSILNIYIYIYLKLIISKILSITFIVTILLFFFFPFWEKEFQLMTLAPNNYSLLLDQDINQFLVQAGIEPQISYITIRDFTIWVNWNPLIVTALLISHINVAFSSTSIRLNLSENLSKHEGYEYTNALWGNYSFVFNVITFKWIAWDWLYLQVK